MLDRKSPSGNLAGKSLGRRMDDGNVLARDVYADYASAGRIETMSATAMLELKQQLSRLSAKERQEVAAFLHRLNQESPAWRKEMSRRMAEMDGGVKFQVPKRGSRS